MRYIPQYEPIFDCADLITRFNLYFHKEGWMTEFTHTKDFEDVIKDFLDVKHCIMVNNGSISLSLALLAVGVGVGDEVIVPDLTMIATANAVKLIGAVPVFVDVEPSTLCMDMVKAQASVSSKTKAMIYVTYNGRSRDPVELQEFCLINNLFYVSDDAQSLGSKYQNGKKIGTFGDISSFSFSMPKIITTGQGGCLVTDNNVLADKIRKLKDFGRVSGGIDIHDDFGINCKFTDLQALVGLSQFRDIDERVLRKRAMFKTYQMNLKNVSQVMILNTDLKRTTPWFADVFVERRDELVAHLLREGIKTRVMYPPIHSQKCYDIIGDFEVAERVSAKGLWLPSSLSLTNEQIVFICSKMKEFYGSI